jgi:hypothetical protein
MSYFAAAATAGNFKRRPNPSAGGAPEGLTPSLMVRYLDTIGDVQTLDASGGGSITVIAPAYVFFDASGSRSVETDSDDRAGALFNLGYEWDFGEDLGSGNWPFAGPQGAVQLGRGRRTAREAHLYTSTGAKTVRLRLKDSADREATVSLTVTVQDPLTALTRVDLSTGAGSWGTLQSNRCYTLDGDYTSWGSPPINGLVNVKFVRHPSASANPQIASVNLDSRTEGSMGTAITRTRGVCFDRVDCAGVQWGLPGFDWCSFSRGAVPTLNYQFNQVASFQDAVSLGRGETVANNIRYPIGLMLWDTGVMTSSGSFVIYSHNISYFAAYGVDFHKNDGDSGGQVFRGRWYRSIWRHCRFRNTGASTGYGRFEGGECRAANSNLPDEWRTDARVGDYAGGFVYGYPAEDNDVTNCYFGASGETQPANGIGTGPENNLEGFPNQSQRYCYFENFYIHTTGVQVRFGGGLWISARHGRYNSNESTVPADIENAGAGNSNRLPDNEEGPYLLELTSTRPVPTAF